MCLSLNNCCCCITLNIGAKIISIICTITAAASAVLYGTAAGIDSELSPSRWLFYVVMAATSMLQLVCGALMVCGLYSKSPKLSWPWTAVSWLKSIFLATLSVAGVVLLHHNQKPDSTADLSTVIFLYFVYAVTLFYFASVVNSRRQQMVLEAREKRSKLVRHRVFPSYYVDSR